MHVTKLSTAKKILPLKPKFHKKLRPKVAEVESGAAGMRHATVAMKKITKGQSVLTRLGNEGMTIHEDIVQKLDTTDHTHRPGRATVPLLLEKHAIAEVVGGASPRMVEAKYDLAKDYVAHALRRRFGSPEAAFAALQGLTLEVGMACNVHALTKIDEMSGPQAVMSGAIAIDKALALQKSISERPKTIDFEALAAMGKTLKVLREVQAKA